MNYHPTHLLTIDVADRHRDPALASAGRRGPLDGVEDGASQHACPLVDEMAVVGASATFFVTRSLARRNVARLRHIRSTGHQLAAARAE